MNLKTALKSLAHVAAGGAAAAIAPHIMDVVPLIPHINPLTAAVLGSALSSLASAFASPPHQ